MSKSKLVLEPGEKMLSSTRRMMYQGGGRAKFAVHARCALTDRRFVYWDLGRMAAVHLQLGILLQLLVKGRPVSLPLQGLRISRGKYGLDGKVFRVEAEDGTTVMLSRFRKTMEWFRSTLEKEGFALGQTGEEEWRVTR